MKHKKLIYSDNIMQEFNDFFCETYKVIEVGIISTTFDRKELLFCKCPYDGMAINRSDGTLYLKYQNNQNEQFILLENQTIIIENNIIYTTCDTGLALSKNNVEKELERLKSINAMF